ncbi:isoleucine--tRNA ligase [Bacteroides cellulosilyticus]|uniref:isoleucine--tRNA ligase n=1 Tax=Bacteroides cellulosilyticus TaxID=246787 RepID=UPI001C37A4AC|nr:isoleucine--tRNA ligase [Bacteroides cellulosilyticus]MBD8982354.1 isoleucine--tRNA ligase [Bacteroides cellulosilyticus]MBV3636784.1 isoleucine--tRNA ligase [Bacteroides cellulosilyticus]MBV3663099.1 isoleucine--tRNA ligase [Bacteroides cellulosilyticus]MBV3685220.1 isoleucine--tRNA ligase [Bacteroides cellulosilyticus]MBV3693786.1 isoleucine--tRNA ligase [Bacteroides cellulosilyticus]
MGKKFAEYSQFDLSKVNAEVLKKWDENQVFAKSMTEREGCPSFVFYEGPPSANGMPGIHHVMARSIKDIFCRYKTMKGFLVKRKAGWDTHGLPVELGVEKAMGITKEDIGKTISVADYNAACRKDVMKFTKEWEDLTHKMGYWVDMTDPYITYDNRYIETLWWLLKQLYTKGYLYKGYTIQPYSPAAGTGLSSHELNQPGCYRDVKDVTCVAQFKMKNPKPEMAEWGTPYFIAWTTTPWTLPSNTALCVGPKIDYVAVQSYNGYTGEKITVVLAKALLYTHFNKKAEDIALEDYKPGDKLIPFKVIGEYKGPELVGMEYEQLIPWVNPGEGAFRVILGDYVTTEDGTGIVHIAPTFGADDAQVAKAAGVPPLQLINKKGELRPMVDLTGKFYKLDELDENFVKERVNVDLYKEYAGRFVKNDYDPNLTDQDESLDVSLCMMMKANNQAFKIEKHVHNYPHCWRTDKPVLYYPLDSWFIRSTACKDRMIELNKTINWKPESTGTGRFGKWLENLNDWNLSRSRYWGTPLPIWRTEDNSEEICIGSVEELYNEIEKSVAAGFMKSNPYKDKGFVPGEYNGENYDKIDLHRPYVDDIILVSKDGKPMKREADLIDVWFDSGAMPYAQIHYPFENKELLDSHQVYPADFIAEGVDQTRGWFFTLHAIASMVFDTISYKAVISNGLVLDKNGNKMSKRLGNGVDPFSTIEKYGSDPLRWYMITNSSPWDNLKFDVDGIEEVRRKFFGTLYNTYSFFSLYANVDGFEYKEADVPMAERPEIDRWILSVLNTLVKEVDTCYSEYEPTKAGRLISDFVNDNLSNWYVRLNRKRFWGGEFTQDKLSAYQTLYTCLETVAKLMSPIAPFYADKLYMDLVTATGRDNVVSVHLAKFPEYNEEMIDRELEARMQMAQDVTSMVLALRRKVNIKVRQPLQCIMIPVVDEEQRAHIEAVKALIMSEVNVKDIKFVDGAAGVLVKKVKCDFKKMGPKFGKQMKAVAAAVAEMSQEAIAELEKNGSYTLQLDGADVVVEAADVEIFSEDIPGWLVANEGKLTVALDVTVTEELRREGVARELVNRIQNIRKSSGLEITDKIKITLSKNQQTDDAVNEYKDYICNQVLGTSLTLTDEVENGTELNFDDFSLYVSVVKE